MEEDPIMDGGVEVSDEELYRCGECGKKYCEQCAVPFESRPA